jgi:hypothetical protein
MTAAVEVVSVTMAEDDETPCRREGCGRPIRRGQRIVLVLGTGTVHLRCLVQHQPDHLVQHQEGKIHEP